MTKYRARRGFTLIELMVTVAIIGVAAALAVPALGVLNSHARLRDAALDMSGALSYARSEAIRTGDIQLVFFDNDAEGNPLTDGNGDLVAIKVVNDGRPGSTNQNCKIDAGEAFVTIGDRTQVDPGVSSGTTGAPADLGTGDITLGSSFTEPGGNDATWVLFRPEGAPRSFDSTCNVGTMGTGGGAFYATNGVRTAAVVMMPMGNTRNHIWDGSIWTQ